MMHRLDGYRPEVHTVVNGIIYTFEMERIETGMNKQPIAFGTLRKPDPSGVCGSVCILERTDEYKAIMSRDFVRAIQDRTDAYVDWMARPAGRSARLPSDTAPAGKQPDVDVSFGLDSADHGIDHAPTWTLLPRWHVRTEARAGFADDADFVQDGPPMPWEDPDFEVCGFTGWGDGVDVDGGAQ